MAKYKKTSVSSLVPNINCNNEIVLGTNIEFYTKDSNSYIRMKHLVLDRDVFVSAPEAFIYIKKIQEINDYIHANNIFDNNLKRLVQDIILIAMKIDTYNGIKRIYNYEIKNKKLYIL